jgi:hypothetical protein
MKGSTSLWTAAAIASVFLGGCGGGALGQAVVSDACKSGDASCSRVGFDSPLALGASTEPDVHLQLRGSTGPGFHLESAAPSIMEVTGGRVTGVGEGTSALLFVSDDGSVLDFLHVFVKKPTELKLTAGATGQELHAVSGVIEMLPGESLRVSAQVMSDGQPLIGTGITTWTVDPPIARLLREGSEGERRIVAKDVGHAVIRVKTLGVESTLDIVVTDARSQGGAS